MDTKLITAGPLVTEQSAVTLPAILIAVLFVGLAVIIIFAVATGSSPEAQIVALVMCVALVGGALGVLAIDSQDKTDLEATRVSEVISNQYRITSVKPVADEDENKPTATQLCAPLSTDSPEYAGVADGQQIRFKAGSTNCTSDTPDVTIIITHTPGHTLNPDDLRQDTEQEKS